MVRERDEVSEDTGRRSGSDDPEVVNRYSGTGVTATVVGLAVVAIATVILLAQNTTSVPVEFLVFDGEAPLYVLFLVTALVTALVTVTVSAVWRRRRRRARNEHEELQRLRQRTGS